MEKRSGNIKIRDNKGQVAIGDKNKQTQKGDDGNRVWIIITAIAGVVAAIAAVLLIILT